MSVDERRRCKHCGVEVQRIEYVLGPAWMHTPEGDTRSESVYSSCRLTVAEPEVHR